MSYQIRLRRGGVFFSGKHAVGHRASLLASSSLFQSRSKSTSHTTTKSATKPFNDDPLTIGTAAHRELVYHQLKSALSGVKTTDIAVIKGRLKGLKQSHSDLFSQVPIFKVAEMVSQMAKRGIFADASAARKYFPDAPIDSDAKKPDAADQVSPAGSIAEKATEKSGSSRDSGSDTSSGAASSNTPSNDVGTSTGTSNSTETAATSDVPTPQPLDPMVTEMPMESLFGSIKCVPHDSNTYVVRQDFPPPWVSVPYRRPITLPYDLQHRLMNDVQTALEKALFVWFKKQHPDVVRKNGWKSYMAVEITSWPKIIGSLESEFPNPSTRSGKPLIPVDTALQPLGPIRHISVHRLLVPASAITTLLSYAFRIVGHLGDREGLKIISNCGSAVRSYIRTLGPKMEEARQKAIADVDSLEEKRKQIVTQQRAVVQNLYTKYQRLQEAHETTLKRIVKNNWKTYASMEESLCAKIELGEKEKSARPESPPEKPKSKSAEISAAKAAVSSPKKNPAYVLPYTPRSVSQGAALSEDDDANEAETDSIVSAAISQDYGTIFKTLDATSLRETVSVAPRGQPVDSNQPKDSAGIPPDAEIKRDISDANASILADFDPRPSGAPDSISREVQEDIEVLHLRFGPPPGERVPADLPEAVISPDRIFVPGTDRPNDFPEALIAADRMIHAALGMPGDLRFMGGVPERIFSGKYDVEIVMEDEGPSLSKMIKMKRAAAEREAAQSEARTAAAKSPGSANGKGLKTLPKTPTSAPKADGAKATAPAPKINAVKTPPPFIKDHSGDFGFVFLHPEMERRAKEELRVQKEQQKTGIMARVSGWFKSGT